MYSWHRASCLLAYTTASNKPFKFTRLVGNRSDGLAIVSWSVGELEMLQHFAYWQIDSYVDFVAHQSEAGGGGRGRGRGQGLLQLSRQPRSRKFNLQFIGSTSVYTARRR